MCFQNGRESIDYHIETIDEFLQDSNEILDYIFFTLKAPQATENLSTKIINHILLLKDMPEMFAKIEKMHRAERQYRRIVVNHYCLLYTIYDENRTVYIAHMYYLRRDYIKDLP